MGDDQTRIAKEKSPSLLTDLLAAGRVSNLPLVWSNVLVGIFFGLGAQKIQSSLIAAVLFAASLIYLAGCFLNDWADASWDKLHKSDRAIPSGRLSRALMLSLAMGSFTTALGVLIALVNGEAFVVTVVLIGAIALYTWLHKKTPWGVLPMGVSRGLLPVLGYASVAPSIFWESGFWNSCSYLLALTAYVAALSLYARCEAKGLAQRSHRLLAGMFFLLVLFVHLGLLRERFAGLSLGVLSYLFPIGLVVFGLMAMKKNVGRGVSWLLSGLALVDAAFLFSIGFSSSSSGTVQQFAFSAAVFSALCFLIAKGLQRWAPAT